MKKQWIMALVGIALLAALLVAPDEALAAAQRGVTLFAGTLLPSLFPFLVASQLIAQSGALSWTGQALGRVTPRLFGLPGNSALALCLSIASGYPAGARVVGELQAQGELTPRQARWASQLASHAGPAFIIGTLGTAMLGDSRLGFILWGCHVAAGLALNLALGAFRRVRGGSPELKPPALAKPLHLSDILLGVGKTLVIVGGTVVLFSVVLALLTHWGVMDVLSRALAPALSCLGISPHLSSALLSGMVEMTAGCQSAAASGAPLAQVMTVMAFLLGFGGLSIQAQSLSLMPGVSLLPFLGYKTAQALVSAVLTRAVLQLLPATQAVFYPLPTPYLPMSFGQLAALAGFALAMFLVFYLCMALLVRFSGD